MVFLKLFDLLPTPRSAEGYHRAGIKRKTSDRLQLLRPSSSETASDRHDTIRITPYEAAAGTQKLVNIPWGFQKRIYRLKIPPGTRDGSILRLKGLGRMGEGDQRGDLYLKVRVAQPR